MSNVNETFDGLNLDSYTAPQAFDDNTQVDLRIVKADFLEGTSEKTGKDWRMLKLACQAINFEESGLTNPKTVYHTIFLTTKDSSPKDVNDALGKLTTLYNAIGTFPEDGVPKVEDFLGQEFSAVVKREMYKDEPQNAVKFLNKKAG